MESDKKQDLVENGLFSFDPIVLVRDVIRRWALILLVVVIAGASAYIVADVQYEPVYRTQITFVVTNRSSSSTVYTNLSSATSLAEVFADLLNYKSQTYWEKHPTITFSTLYEERTYQIFAAFRDQIHDESKDVYRYYEFIDPATEEAFNEGIAYFKSNTKYDMGVDVAYGDSLLMLSTCDRTIAEGRFVVVAKLVSE